MNQATQKQVSKFSQKPPKEKINQMIRYREFRKQRVEPEYDGVISPDNHFINGILEEGLANDYIGDPHLDIPVHSANQNRRLI